MSGAPSLVALLADGGWHRGPALAESLGVTRAAISARVADLRALGLDVYSVAGRGYRLAAPLELLAAPAIHAALDPAAASRLDTLEIVERIDSTNTELGRRRPAGTTALFAEYQSAARGRGGRGWTAPFGANLYLSVAADMTAPRAPLGALGLAAGIEVAAALTVRGARGIGLKWPNDLYAGGRKLGGILIEHRGEIDGRARVIAGIGLNLSMRDAAIDQPWTRLADHLDGPVGRNALAGGVLSALLTAISTFERDGFAVFMPRWDAFDVARDAPVRIIESQGEWRGIARGIAADGALRVESATGMRTVYSGDVSLRVSA